MAIDDWENLNSNVGIDGETKTDKTVKAYLSRGNQMWNRAANELNTNSSEITSGEFINWLEQKLPMLKPPSRRQYIAATRCLLEDMCLRAVDDNHQQALMNSLKYANAMKSEKYHPAEPIKNKWCGATSSQKSKRFSDEEFKLFLSEVKQVKWKWGTHAAVWIAANKSVGLRPSEWRTASLKESSQIILEVINGKNSNGRANGELRHLDITNLKEEEIVLIKRQLEHVAVYEKNDKDWNAYYDGIRQTIYRIVRRFQSNRRKYPSLYSTRHQFAADAKSSGMNLAEIAALMGHATDETATMHYGKKKHGRSGFRVKPDVTEVATVRLKAIMDLHDTMKI